MDLQVSRPYCKICNACPPWATSRSASVNEVNVRSWAVKRQFTELCKPILPREKSAGMPQIPPIRGNLYTHYKNNRNNTLPALWDTHCARQLLQPKGETVGWTWIPAGSWWKNEATPPLKLRPFRQWARDVLRAWDPDTDNVRDSYEYKYSGTPAHIAHCNHALLHPWSGRLSTMSNTLGLLGFHSSCIDWYLPEGTTVCCGVKWK